MTRTLFIKLNLWNSLEKYTVDHSKILNGPLNVANLLNLSKYHIFYENSRNILSSS